MTGEEDIPKPFAALGKSWVNPLNQTRSPFKSMQKISFEENWAMTRRPSLTIVGAATQVLSWQIVRPVALNFLSQIKFPLS